MALPVVVRVQSKGDPAVWVLKLRPNGKVSVKVIVPLEAIAPSLVKVTVYSAVPPGVKVDGPVLLIRIRGPTETVTGVEVQVEQVPDAKVAVLLILVTNVPVTGKEATLAVKYLVTDPGVDPDAAGTEIACVQALLGVAAAQVHASAGVWASPT